MVSEIQKLQGLGQSLWYDNIQRRLLKNGELAALIQAGEIRGITSNPSIFNNAIAKSSDYDDALLPMAWAGWPAEKIFYQLAVEDIRAAADLFAPLYERTKAGDGYVSIEVSPYLARSTAETVDEAQRLWQLVNRPNVMIKIPATREGIPAIQQTIAAGINVNVTLIFSLERYAEVTEAYLCGLEERVSAGKPIDRIASVASFFVSRVDSKVDQRLGKIIQAEDAHTGIASQLLGKAAIANAKQAYANFLTTFGSDRFQQLKATGARLQRPLWASTSTKNPIYRDVIYIEELIGPDTVNTVPPQTLDAFREHGRARITLTEDLPQAQSDLAELETLGISMQDVTQELEEEGVKAFSDAFTALLKTIDERRARAIEQPVPVQATSSREQKN
ncbi:MAG: transaldolase [Anaerolineaceae bacterium]|nr:transaldolase [Anaerolineaceae bacterium]